MSHTDRCRFAKTGPEKCHCSCKGTLHGKKDKSGPLGSGEILLTSEMGGEIEQFLKDNLGKEYFCYGDHKKSYETGNYIDLGQVHTATEFWGIKTTGSGLKDKSGNIYEVFAICSNPRHKGINYQTSYRHFPGMVEKASIEKEYVKEWGNP